jgi:hypothetical protein
VGVGAGLISSPHSFTKSGEKYMEQDYITEFVDVDILDERQFKLLDFVPKDAYKVIDNFLPDKEFENFSMLLDGSVPMRYNPTVSNRHKTKDDGFYFHHVMYDRTLPQSELYELLCFPLLNRLNYAVPLTARVNWFPQTMHIHEHGIHVDANIKHKVLLFYVNTNNGYTRISKDVIVESKANRALLFDGYIPHNSTTATDVHLRCNININLIPFAPNPLT